MHATNRTCAYALLEEGVEVRVENEGKTLETDVIDDWIECSATFQLNLGLWSGISPHHGILQRFCEGCIRLRLMLR